MKETKQFETTICPNQTIEYIFMLIYVYDTYICGPPPAIYVLYIIKIARRSFSNFPGIQDWLSRLPNRIVNINIWSRYRGIESNIKSDSTLKMSTPLGVKYFKPMSRLISHMPNTQLWVLLSVRPRKVIQSFINTFQNPGIYNTPPIS